MTLSHSGFQSVPRTSGDGPLRGRGGEPDPGQWDGILRAFSRDPYVVNQPLRRPPWAQKGFTGESTSLPQIMCRSDSLQACSWLSPSCWMLVRPAGRGCPGALVLVSRVFLGLGLPFHISPCFSGSWQRRASCQNFASFREGLGDRGEDRVRQKSTEF